MKIQGVPQKHRHIRTELVSAIRAGVYQPGDKLPSEHELSRSFAASRSTVIRALRILEDERLIDRRQGSGSFVTSEASHLVAKRTVLGFLNNLQSGRFPDSIVDQLQRRLSTALQRRGSALITHCIEATDDPAAIARNILEQRVDGIFMVPMPPWFSEHSNQQLVEVIGRNKVPIVLLDSDLYPSPRRSRFDLIGVDNRQCGYLQTEHLLKMGLRRILYLGIKGAAPTVIDRREGYLRAMRDYGVDVPAGWLCDAEADDVEPALVSAMMRQWNPEGIVCKSDEFAALLMNQLAPLGIQVPRDLKVVGIDDRPIGSLLPVTLTTIRQPVAEIAEEALHAMDRRIAQPDRAAVHVQLAGELIVRQSTGMA